METAQLHYGVTATGTISYTTPAINRNNGSIYVGTSSGIVYALTSSGTLEWTYTTGAMIYSSPIIGADGTIYIGSNDGYQYALNSNGTLKWKYQIGYSVYNLALDNSGTLYSANSGTKLYAFQDPTPVASFTANATSGTAPLNVQFNDTSSNNPTSWLWNFGDGGSSTQQNPTYTYNTPGTYTVTLTSANGAGNNTATQTNYITVNAPATSSKFHNQRNQRNSTIKVQFNDTSSNSPTSWLWNFGDGGSSTLQNPTYTYNTPGTYNVTLTATNAGGNNTVTQTGYITVNYPAPVAGFTENTTSGLNPLNVQFNDQSTGTVTSYYWTFGDGGNSTLQNPTYTYNTPGTYTVTETVTGPGGNNTATQTNVITVFNSTPPNVTGTPSSGTYSGTQSVTLSSDQPGSTIHYTTDGSNPQTSPTKVPYSAPIPINSTTTLQFAAVNQGGVWSTRYTNTYIILQQTVYVSPTGSDTTGTGSAANPYATIQNGLNNTVAGGTLNLMPGTYTGTGDIGLNITQNVNIIGTSQTNTIINAVCLNNVFSVNSGVNVTIANLTFANGTTSDGGAIYNLGTLTVNNCTFTGNTGTSTDYNYGGGGAIYNNGGTSTVNNCIFTGNTVIWYGGAIYNNGGTSTVNNCTFTGNAATSCGGAIYNNGGTSTVNNCTFTGNTVKNSYGGAYVNSAGTSNVTNSSFIGNTALTFGGAVSNYASMNVSNCIFTNNTVQRGGAFYNAVGTLTVTYSSFVNNSAYEGGSAIYRKSGTVNAQYNWWGSNSNPSSQFYSTVTYTNWLYMTETVTPSTIINGSTATVTVSFNNISNGTSVISINPVSGHIPDGTVVNFNSVLGTFNPTTTVTASGIATTTFTATNIGSNFINATTNNQTVSTGTTVYLPIPAANFTTNTTSGTNPLNVQFTDTSSNTPTSWLWNFGDGGSSTLQNPTYTYNTPGKYTVTLTATNSYGNNTITMNNLIDVIGPVTDITTGLSYNSIQAAINDVNTNNGDTITVAAGNYTENVFFNNKSLTLEALGVVDITPSDYTQAVFALSNSGSTIEGFTISGSTDSGIFIQNSTGNTITNDTILGNGTMTWGICLLNCNGTNYITNNVVNNCTEGINLYNVDGATITNNAATDNEYDGIALTNSNDNTIINNNGTTQNVSGIRLNSSNDNTVANNNLTGNIWTSISLVTSQFNQITNNTASNDQEGMYLYSSDNNTVSGNTADNNTWDGIAVADSNNNTIQDNDNVTNNNSGIRIIGASSGNQVLNNVVTSNAWADMSLDTAGNTTISGNTFTNSEEGIFIYNSNGNTLTNNTMNNDIWDGIYIGNSDNNTLTGNSMSNGGYGVRIQGSTGNSIIANNFVNNYDQAYDNGSNETWNNSTTGNYYNDWNSTNPRPVDGGSNIDQYPTTTPN